LRPSPRTTRLSPVSIDTHGALMRTHPSVLGVFIFILCVAMAGACQNRESPAPPVAQTEYIPTATIKDLMLSVIDPSADVVWLSVTTVVDDKGLVETVPKSDDDWRKVRHGAVTLMEAANLLMIPGRRVARPGEKSETPGVELEPEEMDALIAKDRAAWNARATRLHDAMVEVIQAIDAKDGDKVFELGEKIEEACENCHKQYWYPNEVIPPYPSDTR
jgi:cytochrome c556